MQDKRPLIFNKPLPTNLEITDKAKTINSAWETNVAIAISKWINTKLAESFPIERTSDGYDIVKVEHFIIIMMRTAPDVIGRCLQAGASLYLDNDVTDN